MPVLSHLTKDLIQCLLFQTIQSEIIIQAFAPLLFLTIYIFKGSEGETYSEDCRKYTCQADGDLGVWNDQPDT